MKRTLFKVGVFVGSVVATSYTLTYLSKPKTTSLTYEQMNANLMRLQKENPLLFNTKLPNTNIDKAFRPEINANSNKLEYKYPEILHLDGTVYYLGYEETTEPNFLRIGYHTKSISYLPILTENGMDNSQLIVHFYPNDYPLKQPAEFFGGYEVIFGAKNLFREDLISDTKKTLRKSVDEKKNEEDGKKNQYYKILSYTVFHNPNVRRLIVFEKKVKPNEDKHTLREIWLRRLYSEN